MKKTRWSPVVAVLGCLALAQPTLAQVAPNDQFGNCTPLFGPGGTVAGNNVGATPEPGEPSNGPLLDLFDRTVWWCWTAPSNGCFYFSTEGSMIDTVLCVFTGSVVNNLTTVGCNDDFAPPARSSRVEFAARSGENYKLRVDGYGREEGDIMLHWGFSPRPAHDHFTNAVPIAGAFGSVKGHNCESTREPDEPANGPWPLYSRTVWWRWVAPAGGSYEFTTVGSSFDTVLCAFTGGQLGGLETEACDDDYFGSGGPSRVTVFTHAGTTHYFRVDGYNGSEGTITLEWQPAAALFAGSAVFSKGKGCIKIYTNSVDVTNIISGTDGARVELGQSEGWQASFPSLDLSPPNTTLRVAAQGTVGSLPGHQVGLVRMYCSTNSALGVAADFSAIGSATAIVEVRDRMGQVVSRFQVPNDTAIAFRPVHPADMPVPCLNSFVLERGRPTVWCHVCRPVSVFNPEPGGAGLVDLASYCIFADAALAPVQSISSIELTAEGLNSFRLENPALRVNGLFHRASGSPFPAGTPQPSIWGDCDGDSILGPPCPPRTIRFDWFDPGCVLCPSPRLETLLDYVRSYYTDFTTGGGPVLATQPGAYLRLLSRGNLGGISTALGELRMTRGASNWTMTADYTPAGSTSQRLELYNRGVLVARFAGHLGAVAHVPVLPDGCGKGNPFPWPPGDPCFLCKWLQPQLIVIPGVAGGPATILADEIRVLAENPSAPLRYLESFALETAGIPSFSLSNERALPAVLAPLQIRRQTNGVLITLQTEVNRSYNLEYTTELDTSASPWALPANRWLLLQTIQGNGLLQTVLDSSVNVGIPGGGGRVYRLRALVP